MPWSGLGKWLQVLADCRASTVEEGGDFARAPMLAGAKLWAGERGCLCLASIGVVGEFAGLNEVLGDLAEFEVQSLGCAS